MQVIGRSCAACERPIVVAGSADGCAACDLVFHGECLATESCPECARPFREAEQAVDAEAARARALRDSRGRGAILRVLGALLAFDGCAALFVISSQYAKPHEIAGVLGNLAINGGLAYLTYRRKNWARVVYGILISLSGAALFALGLVDPRGLNPWFIVLALVRLVPAAVLLLSEHARGWTNR